MNPGSLNQVLRQNSNALVTWALYHANKDDEAEATVDGLCPQILAAISRGPVCVDTLGSVPKENNEKTLTHALPLAAIFSSP